MVSASSSDIQRKVTLIISHSINPRFPLSAPESVAHTHVLCFLGSARPRGEYKVFCTGGVTPLSEDARVETANVKGKALHHSSCSLISLQVRSLTFLYKHDRRRVVWIELHSVNGMRCEVSSRIKHACMHAHPIITASSKIQTHSLPSPAIFRLSFFLRNEVGGRISDTPLQPVTAGPS